MMISRFAPTPSGFLHIGNAANALLTSWLAARHGGRLALRIDDGDTSRTRGEYVDDIFEVLDWLGIAWQIGPRDRRDLDTAWSARHRFERYRTALTTATAAGLPVYACGCSRSRQSGPATGGCVGGCADSAVTWLPGRTALRLRVRPGTIVDVDEDRIDLARELGDFVVWRRDDLPAYQLTSIVDDADLGTTHVVRGRDLIVSTAAQRYLAHEMGLASIGRIQFLHHDVVRSTDGTKLSKSQSGHGRRLPRSSPSREAVAEIAEHLGAPIGIRPPR